MTSVLHTLLQSLHSTVRSRAALQLEILALRHQLLVLQRTMPRRLPVTNVDRWPWVWLSRLWTRWRTALVIVKPATVIARHRRGFRLFWTWKSRGRTGRPTVPLAVRTLIRTMSEANSALGRASHPRRTPETWHRGRPGQRRQIHDSATPAAIADMAVVLKESHRPDSWPRISSWSRARPTASCSS